MRKLLFLVQIFNQLLDTLPKRATIGANIKQRVEVVEFDPVKKVIKLNFIDENGSTMYVTPSSPVEACLRNIPLSSDSPIRIVEPVSE